MAIITLLGVHVDEDEGEGRSRDSIMIVTCWIGQTMMMKVRRRSRHPAHGVKGTIGGQIRLLLRGGP